jgi:hypothetical protein
MRTLSHSGVQATPRRQPDRAELVGEDTCSAGGISARSSTPVLTLCRELLAQGMSSDQAVEVYIAAVGTALPIEQKPAGGPQ